VVKKLLMAVLAVLCIASLIAATGASAAEDHEPPELVSLSISPSEVNVAEASRSVTITAHLKDNLSGVDLADISFKGPGSQTAFTSLALIEGSDTNGIYRNTVTIPRFAEAGEWRITQFDLRDHVENRLLLDASQLKELEMPFSIQVSEAEEPKEEEPPAETSLPRLSELSFEPGEINVTESEAVVRVDAHIEAEAGLKEGYVRFRSPNGLTELTQSFERLSGTEFDGHYAVKVLFPHGAEGGKWHAEVWLGDHAGHESLIGPEGLDERGLPSSVFVVDSGEEPEEEEPPLFPGKIEATELVFAPTELDTTESKAATDISAHIVTEAGFASARVQFRSPSGERTSTAFLELESGDEVNGTYVGQAGFGRFSEAGAWLAELEITDALGRKLVLGPEQLAAREMPYEVTVFDEAAPPVVTGISPSSGPEAGGTPVHLSGSGFKGATAVHFGGSLAEFIYESPESITAFAPPGTGNVGVAVTSPAGISGEVNYHYEATTPVALTSSPNPSVRGQKVTFTATVSPSGEGAPTPLGTVAFVEGTSTLGVVNLSKGVAKLNTTALGAGGHAVVAEYSGDSHYPAGSSSSVTQIVAKASTEMTLTSSLNPAPFGSSGTLKAHVAAVAPGVGTPAGTVTFREGETILDTVQLSGGNASLSLKSLAPGTHAIRASYSGDANDYPSEVGPVKQMITAATTELELSSTLNPAPFGSSATLKATVRAVAPGGGTPVGTVTFREGETVLATLPLAGGSAKYALKTTAPGEHQITATYSGEADYGTSAGLIEQTIVAASTETTLTSTKNPAPHGSAGTLKATVKAIAGGGGTVAGTVTFREGEMVLAVIPLSSGSATYPLKSLAVGSHAIIATYSGNADYGVSKAAIEQSITP
jgi:Bacterial Ig-like domain (group 3)/IPT/TIG domain